MKQKSRLILFTLILFAFVGCKKPAQVNRIEDTLLSADTIQYHPVRINKNDGSILPWFSRDIGNSYDTVLMLVWHFWDNMETDSNGLKYYMNHQVWSPGHDMRGLGGDQVNMALSSWALLYAYTGNNEIVENMKYLADNFLQRSLSDSADSWPFIPYPYNTEIHSGKYDGDMRNGKGITQPDKAGNFGYELVNLYKITADTRYLEAAKRIAGTLCMHIVAGDSLHSPLPFRVNAKTGKAGILYNESGSEMALYTSNWTCTMMLMNELMILDENNIGSYQNAFNLLLEWMKSYPLKTNKWGPFFEDIPGWSDTQTNAISFAVFIMQNPELFPGWKEDVKKIFDWTYNTLGNDEYMKYKVRVMNEQTVYKVPGNSHSSRQASAELMYTSLTGDSVYYTNAVRTLNWATYTVASDGRNRYIRDDIWLTDGYGDYVRHYLRSMAVCPELAPSGKNRFLGSESTVCSINYLKDLIQYTTYGPSSKDVLRLKGKPQTVECDGKKLIETANTEDEGYKWIPLDTGGSLIINHKGKKVKITL